MKTPAEIKKELRNAKHVQCMDISDGENECVGTRYGVLVGYVLRDAIYIYITQLESDNESKQKRIEQLESRLAQAERERDAAVHDLKLADRVDCDFCKHQYGGCTYDGCKDCSKPCPCGSCRNSSNYEWRGVCEANTEEGTK